MWGPVSSSFRQAVHYITDDYRCRYTLQKAQSRRTGSMRSRGSISGCSPPRVVLYAACSLFPLNRTLAEKYCINADNPVGEFYSFSQFDIQT